MQSRLTELLFAVMLVTAAGGAVAAEPGQALKVVIEAAKKEGALNLSHGQSVVGRVNGIRRIEAELNAMFGTNIRINFAPGPATFRQAQQLVLEYNTGQKANTDTFMTWPQSLAKRG